MLNRFCAAGLEGVISKKADEPYVASRAGGWLKIKCIKRQEFVIVGWTPSDKAREFRSLLLGVQTSALRPAPTHRDLEDPSAQPTRSQSLYARCNARRFSHRA
ncbi:hypothetical protein CIT31_15585 [Mesorhizobium wenxiniae]|uniref:ATP-dependent DNA ligase family profile domain-containing protein n=1 Tax=Mesorhizobium wenxiniae TaxID=2014805 RepID=A0A271KKB2_9HYPH|nr:hypothetical protein CIT31_15585 [Mesorhizobium wenxiniae]